MQRLVLVELLLEVFLLGLSGIDIPVDSFFFRAALIRQPRCAFMLSS